MTRAALYARYSSDLQSAASIDDQFRVCREHAERSGWTIAGGYRDAAVSELDSKVRVVSMLRYLQGFLPVRGAEAGSG